MRVRVESLFVDDFAGGREVRDDLEGLVDWVTPFMDYDRRERQERVRVALGLLAPRDRRIIELKFGFRFNPCSYREIARREKISAAGVNQRVHRAQRILRIE